MHSHLGDPTQPRDNALTQAPVGVTFEFALARRCSRGAESEPFSVHQTTDMIRLRFAVQSDDNWIVEVGEHPSVGACADPTLRTITGNAETSAVSLLRALADQVTFPHSFSLEPASE